MPMVHELTGRKSLLLVTLLFACGGRAQGTASATDGGTGAAGGAGGASGGTRNLGAGGDARDDVPTNLQCSDFEPCGGTLAGNWTVVDSCLLLGGVADVRNWGLACESAPVLGTLAVTGDLSVSSAGSLVDATRTTGQVELDFDTSCLNLSGVRVSCEKLDALLVPFGYQSGTCREVGQLCRCNAVVDQLGSMGFVSDAPVIVGTVSLDSPSTFTAADARSPGQVAEYSFCAKDNRLTVKPKGAPGLELVGAIVLAPR